MEHRVPNQTAAVALVTLLALVVPSSGSWAQQPGIKAPVPGVPELFTIEGEFVRIAYDNEDYVSLGYRAANHAAGKEWMLLEVGLTMRHGAKSVTVKRDDLSIETPDGKTISLASQDEYLKGNLRALEMQADTVRDSINYFPKEATNACRLGFFVDVSRGPGTVLESVELSPRRACMGRIFFNVPGGIQYGQHWLNVRFEKSLVRVPFRILTKEDEEKFRHSWKDIKKEHEKTFGK